MHPCILIYTSKRVQQYLIIFARLDWCSAHDCFPQGSLGPLDHITWYLVDNSKFVKISRAKWDHSEFVIVFHEASGIVQISSWYRNCMEHMEGFKDFSSEFADSFDIVRLFFTMPDGPELVMIFHDARGSSASSSGPHRGNIGWRFTAGCKLQARTKENYIYVYIYIYI